MGADDGSWLVMVRDTVRLVAMERMLAASVLAGCALAGCGSPTVAEPTSRVGRFLYAADVSAGAIKVYDIDASTGALSVSAVSPIKSDTPMDLCFAADDRFMYVANFQGQGESGPFNHPAVLGYQLDSTSGSASPVPGSPFASQGFGPTVVAADPTGHYVYVGNYYPPSTIAGYRIDETTGALLPVPGSPFATSTGPASIAMAPSGRFLYAGSFRDLGNPVSAFAIDQETGRLNPVPPSAASRNAWAVAIAPAGDYLYVTNGGGLVSAFALDASSGALSQDPVSRIPTGGRGGAFSVVMSADGTALFLANAASGDVSAFAVDKASGNLTPAPGSPFPTGINARSGGYPSAIAVDPSGSYVYVWNHDTNNISAYRVDHATRALVLIPGSPFEGGGGNLKVLP
jgi:6-phosphogluconolactonase (cycloisomerase 2 family)